MTNDNKPLYVRLGLLGVNSRPMAMMFFWLSVALAIGATLYSGNPIGLILLLAALWYWVAIRWMDHNNGWPTQ